ncbi:MAG: S46 family peptidase [Bacteroidota bacterium]|nr:MAG: S46 family peptidase [Bacteroidota bacterium]
MKQISLLFLLVLVLSHKPLTAREGMWLPVLIEQVNYADLQARGFMLSAEEIYSINRACLTNSVMIFGGGCTAELISRDGLLLTNHHCGFPEIQQHSTLEKNYIRDGFWATKRSEELPNPDLSVSFLTSMVDYTHQVLHDLDTIRNYLTRKDRIERRIDSLEKAMADSLRLEVSIESFFYGNTYYLFTYQVFHDVRLVGTPPESIGSYGGDTDNWVWPRHTGDFSLFRIYTGPDGNPAPYSEQNIPYQPQSFLTISAQGIAEDDFTMVLGFPGSTQQYLYSGALELTGNKLYPQSIALRDGRLEIIDKARSADELVYIQYASKHQRISNAWKKWKGVLYGFNRYAVIEMRKQYEADLLAGAGTLKPNLESLYTAFNSSYGEFEPYYLANNLFSEAIWGIEPIKFYAQIRNNILNLESGAEQQKEIAELTATAHTFFSDYNQKVDKQLTSFMLNYFRKNASSTFQPAGFNSLDSEEGWQKYLDNLYSTSILTDSVRFTKALKKISNHDVKAFTNDPFAQLFQELLAVFNNQLRGGYDYYSARLDSLYRAYTSLLPQIDTSRLFYPDANFTMRLSYGNVSGYSPRDAHIYHFQTYSDGILEKASMDFPDYQVPEKLIELLRQKDFGRYATADGKLPLCFIASNHTSGGNSGSPVLNRYGQLVGINFDRTWEGTMSDFYFSDAICRNISVDIRYVLFIIDKYAQSSYLFDEMDIVW